MSTETAIIQAPAPTPEQQAFQLAVREAKALSQSTLVPKEYRGEQGIANVLIASDIAKRIGASPLLVMQNLYIIQGKPSWSSTFLIATVNACKRFEPMRFEVVGTDPAKDDYRVRAYAKDIASGEVCFGPWITWKMVKAEGWDKKAGSKWMTMPELMFLYRAAGFWTRVYAPEVSMGILTREEAEDIGRATIVSSTSQTNHGNLKALEGELLGRPAEDEVDAPTAAEVRKAIEAAATVDELNEAWDLARDLPEAEAPEIVTLYEQRRDALELDAK